MSSTDGMSAAERDALRRHRAGEVVRFSTLPKNGEICRAKSAAPAGCGWPLLIDGSCVNAGMHAPEPTSTDRLVSLGQALEEFYQLRMEQRKERSPHE